MTYTLGKWYVSEVLEEIKTNTGYDTLATHKKGKKMHTPGPYQIFRMGNQIGICSLTADRRFGTKIACIEATNLIDDDTANANAKLLVAAPELLEACKGMVEWARRVKGSNCGPEVAKAIFVIDKAENGGDL